MTKTITETEVRPAFVVMAGNATEALATLLDKVATVVEEDAVFIPATPEGPALPDNSLDIALDHTSQDLLYVDDYDDYDDYGYGQDYVGGVDEYDELDLDDAFATWETVITDSREEDVVCAKSSTFPASAVLKSMLEIEDMCADYVSLNRKLEDLQSNFIEEQENLLAMGIVYDGPKLYYKSSKTDL